MEFSRVFLVRTTKDEAKINAVLSSGNWAVQAVFTAPAGDTYLVVLVRVPDESERKERAQAPLAGEVLLDDTGGN